MKLWGVATLTIVAFLVTGCGGGEDGDGNPTRSTALDHRQVKREEEEGKTPAYVREAEEQREEAEANGTAKLTGCPENQETYELAEESIEEAEKLVEEGKEVAAAEENIEVSEELAETAEEGCESSKELEATEEEICANSPSELREALEVEDTPANRHYIRVYEEACGSSVLP